MNRLLRAKPRTPAELARALRDALARLADANAGDGRRKAAEETARLLRQAKLLLYGDADRDPVPEDVAQFAQEAYLYTLMEDMLRSMPLLDFELRKDVVQICVVLLQRSIGTRRPTVEHVAQHPSTLFLALHGYEEEDTALNTGMVLREMLQHEPLAKLLLYSDEFYRFPEYIESTSFAVSCDAFSNMKETLVHHRAMTAEYLQTHYARFFDAMKHLLTSPNYVTKRQSVKLLGELLVDRANYAVMMQYVSDEQNLKLVMNLLRDRSRNIQFEAFHIFKVFVANPKKTHAVESVLRRNRDRLLSFLSEFHNEREDESFVDEKQYVMQIIGYVPPVGPGHADPSSLRSNNAR